MRWMVMLAATLLAGSATAENLLFNPDFDLDPTVPGNGWSTIGTGAFTWGQAFGAPTPPSARTDQSDAESMILYQCVSITGGMTLDFSARSFTHGSIGSASNGVALSVYTTVDCSGDPIETVFTDQLSFPSWALRERFDYVTPTSTLSARIELLSEANGDISNISWDNVMVSPQSTPVVTRSWRSMKALFK
jgi:hypothetical protein